MATATIEVYIKLPSGKAISTHRLPDDTVRRIAQVVAKEEGVPETRVRLKYQGKTLDKTKTVGYLGICAETILKGEVIFPKDLTVYVKYPSGQCEPLLVQNTDTVSSLKSKVNDVGGIPPSQQILKKESNGVTVTGADTLLADVGITNECVIEATKCEAPKVPSTNDTIEEEVVDEDQKQGLISTFDTQGKRVEVVFCFDTTGSMYSCLTQVRQKLRSSCERLLRDIPGIRIGVMAQGDYCDYAEYVVRYVDLTSDVDTVVSFVTDVPGSGGGDAPEVRQKLRQTCERLLRDIPNIRIGIMANGDYCDYLKYVVRFVDLTSDVDTVVSFVNNVPSTGGGGNGGECYEWALRKAQQLDWSEDSAKALVMIGDELPHKPSYTDQNLFWMDEADVLAGMGVKIYAVQALNAVQSTPFYQEMAERTNGYYLTLRNFSLITDMFLAVCYREADPGQLDDFVEEVEKEGRMTEDTKAMLQNLEDKPKPTREQREAEQNRRYVAQAWWDPTLESRNTRPEYLYDQAKDSWEPNNQTTINSGPSVTSYTPSYTRPVSGKSRAGKSRLQKMFCFA